MTTQSSFTSALVLSLSALWLIAQPVQAHVQIRPTKAPAAERTQFRLVAENERSDARTRGLDVLLPVGVSVRGPARSGGWAVATRGRRLLLRGPANRGIEPGAKRAFPIVFSLPNRTGDVLVFKVLQRYDDGEIVRWIGPTDAVEPAPRVTITQPKAKPEQSGTSAGEQAATPTTAEQEDEDSSDWLVVAAAIGGVALLGLLAFAVARRRKRSA